MLVARHVVDHKQDYQAQDQQMQPQPHLGAAAAPVTILRNQADSVTNLMQRPGSKSSKCHYNEQLEQQKASSPYPTRNYFLLKRMQRCLLIS
jgi:hypothetical protein